MFSLVPLSVSCVVFLCCLSPFVEAAEYTTSQEVTSSGKTFTCNYAIVYNGNELDMASSRASCMPRKVISILSD